MNKINILNTILLVLVNIPLFSQNSSTNSGGQIVTVQPKIMVIPYTKEDENIRTVLEDDVNKRIAITKIKEAFDNRGFTTIDFETKLKAAKDNNIFTSDNQSDIKSQIIEFAAPDIYVEAEVYVQKKSSGNSVKVILRGNESSTGNALANKVGDSGTWYTEDIGKLSEKAVEQIVEDFLNTMQNKFTEIVNNGKSVIIDISFSGGSSYDFNSEMGDEGLPLSDLLEMWMEENAFKNNYHLQGTTSLKMIFDDVRIPLKDQSNGKNYNPNKFALLLWKYIKSLGLNPTKDLKGNTIYITIN